MAASQKITATRVDLRGRRIVVTGASPGSLGFETARTLADWGARVTVTARTDPGSAVAAFAAVGVQVDGHRLELADANSVRSFAQWYLSEHDGLDVLINNAGIHLDLRSRWKVPTLTVDQYEIHWRTNYLGSAQLTALLLPALRVAGSAGAPSRVVNVVSKLHARARNTFLFEPLTPYNSWAAYGLSKLALIHHATELTRRYPDVSGYSLHPGSVFTHIADRGLEGSSVIGGLRRALAPLERRSLLTPTQGAQTSIYCATDPAAVGGKYYQACAPREPSTDAQDSAVASLLWDQTEAWLAAL